VYHVSAASETKAIPIDGLCTALAVNPQKSEIVWTDGRAVEIVDISERKRRVDIDVPVKINSLCYSPDGKFLAIGGTQWVVSDQAELARLGQVTRARMTQIMNLLQLAPDIQEELLFLPRIERGDALVHVRQLRPIAAVPDWRKQRRMWNDLIRAGSTLRSM
jgi:hypothetical protein